MTVTSTASRIEYIGNGSLTTFAYPFMIFKDADLTVIVAGVTQTLTTDYTVTGAGGASGGNVVFVTAPASAAKISILREITPEQTTDYVENDPLPAETLEDNLDRVTMLVQQHDETFGRSVKLPKASTGTEVNIPDPTVAANQSKHLRIAADGKSIEVVSVGTGDVTDGVITTEGDTIQGNSAGAAERLAFPGTGGILKGGANKLEALSVGANDTLLQVKAGTPVYRTPAQVKIDLDILARSYLAGLGTSRGTDADHDIDIAVGEARDTANALSLILAAALTKRIDATWVAGNDQGGLGTSERGGTNYTFNDNGASEDDITASAGTPFSGISVGDTIIVAGSASNNGTYQVAAVTSDTVITVITGSFTQEGPVAATVHALTINTWYHVHLIVVAGSVDVGFDTSVTAANLVTNHSATASRRLGSVLTGGAANIIAFKQLGDNFLWNVPVSDYNVTNPGTTATSRALTTPEGIQTLAIHTSGIIDSTPIAVRALITSLDQDDTTPSATLKHLATGTAGENNDILFHIRTNTSRQIRTRYSASDGAVVVTGTTHGWIDRRGRDD